MSNDHTAGPDLRSPRDGLDAAGRDAARRGWVRQYFRANVKNRVAGLDELVSQEVGALTGEECEPTP